MKTIAITLFISTLFLQSCMAPVNLNYESASTLKKGNVEIKGAYSENIYSDTETTSFIDNSQGYERTITNYTEKRVMAHNFSASLGIGVNQRNDLKLKYSFLQPNNQLLDNRYFFEIAYKISLREDRLALGAPLQYYTNSKGDNQFAGICPRLYYTAIHKNNFDWTIIPKFHLLANFDTPAPIIYPGISTNIGYKIPNQNITIRLEAGVVLFESENSFDSYNSSSTPFDSKEVSYGVSIAYQFIRKNNL